MKCSRCDAELAANKAKCTSCGKWNATQVDGPPPAVGEGFSADGSIPLNRVKSEEAARIQTGPWDHMWGTTVPTNGPSVSGIVQTSTTLIAGLPGAGKTTLLLQALSNYALTLANDDEVLHIAAEQALPEIRLTADRLALDAMFQNLKRNGDSRIQMVPALGGTANIGNILKRRKPRLVVLDSLQGLCGKDDSAQMEVCDIVKKYAVDIKAPIIIVCQVTKEGDMAGVMTLQHHVDTTMTIAPDPDLIVEEEAVRVQDIMKNRFGRAFIQQEYVMTARGLKVYIPPEEPEEDEEDEDEDDE